MLKRKGNCRGDDSMESGQGMGSRGYDEGFEEVSNMQTSVSGTSGKETRMEGG